MNKYRTRWTHETRRAAFIKTFDDFYDAINYLSNIVTEEKYAVNATIYDIENNKCICSFRNIK